MIEIDSPVHDSPWLEKVLSLVSETAPSVGIIFLELHNAFLSKIFLIWRTRNASATSFGEILSEVSVDLKQFLSAPAASLESLAAWSAKVLLKANATGEWGASVEGFQEQKYKLLHRFTNSTAHELELIDDYTDTGRYWEAPPPHIPPGATVSWGSCGKKGFMGVSSGTCGAFMVDSNIQSWTARPHDGPNHHEL